MFDLTNSQEFYAVLVDDFDDFMREPQSARRALHCAITGYHLHEWVWGDWLNNDYATWKALKILGRDTFCVRDRVTFREWIDAICPWFPIIQDLANGGKHFIRDQGFETKRIQGFGRGPFGVGPYGKGYLLIDFGEGAAEHRWQTAAALLEVVVRFWRDFFRNYRPSPDLPASRHHTD